MPQSPEQTCVITRVRVQPEKKDAFVDWQAKLNALIPAFEGFLSLEILSPVGVAQPEWVIVQRFHKPENMACWRESLERRDLLQELKVLLGDSDLESIHDESDESSNQQKTVTEVFVTQVVPDKVKEFRQWIAKIHQAEAKFPGFRGAYVQSPTIGQGHNWITLLQFDTQENLDRWLSSKERQQVLKESETVIASLESHRVISPFAGWFASLAREGVLPPVWKQTMLVLLVLFPIVMFELKFLSPATASLNPAAATFIGNAISVSLISWPMMPIVIWFLGWWLSPAGHKARQQTIAGTLVVIALYLIEVILLWNLLP